MNNILPDGRTYIIHSVVTWRGGTVPVQTGFMQFCLLSRMSKTGTGVKSDPVKLELPVPVLNQFSSVLFQFFFSSVY